MFLFNPGSVYITSNCLDFCRENDINPIEFFLRHAKGDWGDLDEHDVQENMDALYNGNRLFSSYSLPEDLGKIWVITEWDRSATTILLPEDY